MIHLEKLKEDLNIIRKNKMQGILIRSRAQVVEDNEKPTNFFCNLEKHNFASKIIPKIEKEDGTIIKDQYEILNEVKLFYENLYSDKDIDLTDINLNHLLSECKTKKLIQEEADKLEGVITYEEATFTLKSMSNNRSPGSDGFGAEFFKFFWRNLGHFIVRSLNYGYQIGELSVTQKEGIITCIPKDNKPRQFLKNYRPISLLSCVYKIASGVLAMRLKTTLAKLINKDQTGFIAGRYLGENTRIIYDIMHYTEQNDMPGLLLLVDFEKAFDSISWSFLYKVLEFFGFGNSIISWIKTLYKNAKLKVNQGGNLSSSFTIKRGCRQGDPLSPFIFVLCVEVLACMIRSNKNIKGITVNGTEYRISQYADDTSLLLDGSSSSLNETLKVLTQFSEFSGLKVNFDKTQVIWIGKKKFSTETIKTRWKLSWGKINFKLLGIIFHINIEEMIKINYEEKLNKIKSLIRTWKRRYLTPLGKITVIKSLLLPILNHLFISLPNPKDNLIKDISDLFFDFLWGGGAPKVKYSVIIKQYSEGGLKMINLHAFINSLKATWIRRWIKDENAWQTVIKDKIDINKILDFGANYAKSVTKLINNQFWIDVLNSYSDILNSYQQNSTEFTMASPVFHNNKIKVGGIPIYIKSWYDRGITFVNDFFDESGNFYSQTEFEKKYGLKSNFIQFHGIRQAIREFFRKSNVENMDKKLQYPLLPATVIPFLCSNKGCKDFYETLNRNNEKPTSQNKWINIYDIEENTWPEIYSSPFHQKLSSTMQWFQFRINHRLLPTKKYLHTIKACQSPLCTFCQEEETITHMLWSCPESQALINEFRRWLQSISINLRIIEELYIFNIGKQMTIADSKLILTTKYYIYCTKRLNQTLSLAALKNSLKTFYKIEKQIATKNKALESFAKQWQKYKDLLEC